MSRLAEQTLDLSRWLRQTAGLNWRGRWFGERPSHGVQAGIEAADSRDYATGDDLARVDWNRCARLDELVVRQYFGSELRALDIWIDHSPSMNVDDGAKLQWAKRFAALLALQAIDQGETVRIFQVADDCRAIGGVARGRPRLCRLLNQLEASSTSARPLQLAAAARQYLNVVQSGPTLLILSDVFEIESARFVEAFRLLSAAKVNAALIQLHTQAEANPIETGRWKLADVEGGGEQTVTLRDEDLAAYQAEFARYMQGMRRVCHRAGAIWARVPVDAGFDQVVRVLAGTSRLGRAR